MNAVVPAIFHPVAPAVPARAIRRDGTRFTLT